MSKWIKKDDKVVVLTGNDKGNHGKVLMRRADRVVVEGINMRTKHVKRSQANPQGGLVKTEMPLHISNVALCDDEGNKLKVRVRIAASGAKELVAVVSGKEEVLRVIRQAKAKEVEG